MAESIRIGPLIFERYDGLTVGVTTEEEACGLLDNVYDHVWEQFKLAAKGYTLEDCPVDECLNGWIESNTGYFPCLTCNGVGKRPL